MTAARKLTAWVAASGRVVSDEGLRLFFPLAAMHAALWPVLWVAVHDYSLPLATTMPSSLWHANEMIFGTYGAALIGFITTAVAEWTDTRRPKGTILFLLAALWGIGRAVGFLGAETAVILALFCDMAWLLFLVVYVALVSWKKRTTRLLGFLVWLTGLAGTCIVVRTGFLLGDIELARQALHVAGLVFLGLLGLALARISTPVTNLVLDPSEATSPFRPHPGRLNLAPGLVAVAILGEVAGVSQAVSGYLFIAAGAAFLDRVAEGFVGRQLFRIEIMALSGSSMLSGLGLLLVGAARLGAPFSQVPGLHLALMGGLGLGVLSVFMIAGLLHTGQALRVPPLGRLAVLLLTVSVAMRVLPDLELLPTEWGDPYMLASVFWSGTFIAWLRAYWPMLSDPATLNAEAC